MLRHSNIFHPFGSPVVCNGGYNYVSAFKMQIPKNQSINLLLTKFNSL